MLEALPLPNKSLLHILAVMKEGHCSNNSRGNSDGGEDSDRKPLMENANEENKAVETGEANDKVCVK